MIKTIIVEDDVMHARSLTEMIEEHFKNIRILSVCNNLPDAVQKIQELKPDLVFLDVELGPYNGFDLLAMFNRRDFEVIFTTAYQKYAVMALKMSALDYIEKPVQIDQLREALSRYKSRSGEKKMQNLLRNFQASQEEQKIALFDQGSFLFIMVKDIIWLSSENAYTKIRFRDGDAVNKVLMSKSIAYYQDMLEGKGLFFRVHNQHLVNIRFIKRLVLDSTCDIIMDDNERSVVPVARSRREQFIDYLHDNGVMF
ncbi:MAG TPA: LytTR family DNA-binding domain-containing protein [Bacteroidales bacterium]|jgi:two-component system LytT family response regulator|nr:response regulator transcription factor [Bacteroidales bacterium]MCZ2417482.1 LytTR family DNA-binding domain-containing protein [Burkholderiales bacterium]OQC56567.1 MAG: Transcriptional regulatory protein YehT [Bacteroidetes bacterium ADurb.Bin013]MBP8999764.1 response regulator transcription factor [Bacteroidales bacterium]MBV6456763.1 Transcriptional regulatory protein BtsR [Bacteroidales bacterium]